MKNINNIFKKIIDYIDSKNYTNSNKMIIKALEKTRKYDLNDEEISILNDKFNDYFNKNKDIDLDKDLDKDLDNEFTYKPIEKMSKKEIQELETIIYYHRKQERDDMKKQKEDDYKKNQSINNQNNNNSINTNRNTIKKRKQPFNQRELDRGIKFTEEEIDRYYSHDKYRVFDEELWKQDQKIKSKIFIDKDIIIPEINIDF